MIRYFNDSNYYKKHQDQAKLSAVKEFLRLNFQMSKQMQNKILSWQDHSLAYIQLSFPDIDDKDFFGWGNTDYISIFDVDDPSEEIQLTSVKQSLTAYEHIKKPYPSVTKYFLECKIKSQEAGLNYWHQKHKECETRIYDETQNLRNLKSQLAQVEKTLLS